MNLIEKLLKRDLAQIYTQRIMSQEPFFSEMPRFVYNHFMSDLGRGSKEMYYGNDSVPFEFTKDELYCDTGYLHDLYFRTLSSSLMKRHIFQLEKPTTNQLDNTLILNSMVETMDILSLLISSLEAENLEARADFQRYHDGFRLGVFYVPSEDNQIIASLDETYCSILYQDWNNLNLQLDKPRTTYRISQTIN